MTAPGKSGGRPLAAITVTDLHVDLGGVAILEGVNVEVRHGEITALIGPNGAGKTTLLLAILGIVPYRGQIKFNGGQAQPRIGYVPQTLDFDRGMPATVMDFLCMGHQRRPLWISQAKGQKQRARDTLALTMADHLEKRRLGNLSGGELQRVLLARALMEGPDIILLDEPASAVDRSGEELFMKLIKKLNQEKKIAILMVSHDLTMVTRLARQVICLNRVVLSEGKTADVVNEKTLSACFGADKGILLHDHGWDGEVSCAYDEAGHEHASAKDGDAK
ncbi:MAG TPA: metal ABC transporter ATP-binding protein [bacterium]|nr:metal ABC transporter ATP-binding protein [bacterium]